MNHTFQIPSGISNILGTYDEAHWQTVVAELKPDAGILLRGSVLSAVAADGGKLTLTTAGSEATAYAFSWTRASTLPRSLAMAR